MSSLNGDTTPDDAPRGVGTSLVPFKPEGASAAAPESAGASTASRPALRWVIPVALIAMTGGVGWFAGAQAGLTASSGDPASIESALASELKAQTAVLAAMEERLRKIESVPSVEAALKPAIHILAERIDEIARRQTVAVTQLTNRLERSEKESGSRLDRMAERIDRIERQVSSAVPVGSTGRNVTTLTRTSPEVSPKSEPSKDQPSKLGASKKETSKHGSPGPDAGTVADDVRGRQVRGYVLRDVFQGGALVESRYGLMEVFPGLQLPGAGRVRSVEKRDGRWVVVTTAGVIEARR